MTLSTRLLLAGAATALLVTGSAAAANAAAASPSPRLEAATTRPAQTAHVRAVSGAFSYEMTATASTIHDVELFGDIRDGRGTGGRPAVRPDEIKSMGFVAGGTSFDNGVSGAHLSGVAGSDVTAVTVVPPTGGPVPATLDHGLWAAAWQGDPDADGGRAEVEFTTSSGQHRTVSTDDIDWIAAEQRAGS
jgi:hypothetical protein